MPGRRRDRYNKSMPEESKVKARHQRGSKAKSGASLTTPSEGTSTTRSSKTGRVTPLRSTKALEQKTKRKLKEVTSARKKDTAKRVSDAAKKKAARKAVASSVAKKAGLLGVAYTTFDAAHKAAKKFDEPQTKNRPKRGRTGRNK